MAKGRVGTNDRQLPAPSWSSGAQTMRFRAAVIRNRYLWAVQVLAVSSDHEQAFVRFESESAGVTATAWVSVDELRPG